MAYTTLRLINEAYNTAGIVSKEFETVAGDQAQWGLDFLNDLIGDKVVDDGLIPYYNTQDITAVTNQETYFIEDCISIETFVFFINSVRYSTTNKKRRQYFGESRADDIQSLPVTWHFERAFGGGNLYIYFKPDQAYPMTIWGLFRLNEVSINQDLSLTLDRFYINFLKFELADRLCAEYNYNTPMGVAKALNRYRGLIKKKSARIDLRMEKVSTLQKRGGINYGQANLGKGWTT